MKRLILATTPVLLAILTALSAVSAMAADDTPVKAAAGEPCAAQGDLVKDQGTSPLACVDGVWTNPTEEKPFFYAGKCSYRYQPGDNAAPTISVKAGGLADICLPVGWRVKQVAASNMYAWRVEVSNKIPNVVMLKAASTAQKPSEMWIYPDNGKDPLDRIGVTLAVAQK